MTAPAIPPISWFRNPGLTELTPLTVADDGRVYGHLAGWDVPHRSFPGRNITAPKSRSNYRHFRTGSVQVQDGDQVVEVSAGNLTIGGGHADTHLSAADTSAYYDSACQIVAQVGIGEDRFGVWVAGALMPDVDAFTLRRFRACSLSGDWRAMDGHLDLIAALAVPTPGFPIPRARVASGAPQALVAAGALVQPASFGRAVNPSWRKTDEPEPDTFKVNGVDLRSTYSVPVRRIEITPDGDVTFVPEETPQPAPALSDEHAALLASLDDSAERAAALLAELDDTQERMTALLAALADDEDDDLAALGRLEKVPGVQNWIEKLPAGMRAAWNKSIVYRAAIHMHEERGMPVGMAIASSLNWARHICATGDVKQWKGPQSVNPKSKAECCAAIALWESMKAAAKAD